MGLNLRPEYNTPTFEVADEQPKGEPLPEWQDKFDFAMEPPVIVYGSSIAFPPVVSDSPGTIENCQVELTSNPVGNLSVDCIEHGFLGCIANSDGDTERKMANAIFDVHIKGESND